MSESIWVVVGDSFSDPQHSGYGESGVRAWPDLAGEQIGVEVRNFASSGDGYVHRRSMTFVEQAAAAARDESFDHGAVTRVIVYGGINDYACGEDAGAVQAAAAEVAQLLAGAFSTACIEGFMNWYPHVLDDAARACIGAVSVGLGLAGVPLHTDSMWILENDGVEDAYLDDNLHPNQHGHDLMADFFSRTAQAHNCKPGL